MDTCAQSLAQRKLSALNLGCSSMLLPQCHHPQEQWILTPSIPILMYSGTPVLNLSGQNQLHLSRPSTELLPLQVSGDKP